MGWPKGKPRKLIDPPAPEVKPTSWVCIRNHYNNVETVKVGTIRQAEKVPGKHWHECDPDNPNVIQKLREGLDALGVLWSPDWDISRLEYEMSKKDEWTRQKANLDKWRKETGGRA
jgi:hypothetical protein